MPFPHHDRFWTETANFISQNSSSDAALLAPDEFVELFSNVYSYAAPTIDPNLKFDWIVIHKGLYDQLDPIFVDFVVSKMPAVLANKVFVVFSNNKRLKPLSVDSVHVVALRHILKKRSSSIERSANPKTRLRPVNFAVLDVEGVREVMNQRYSQDSHDQFGGYEHPHLWDRVRYHEVDRLFLKLLGDVSLLDVLEIGCGIGRNASFFRNAASYLGTDLSDVAITKARQRCLEHPSHRFEVMDAMDLKLEDKKFDLVLGAEIIEHVQDVEKMLRGIYRVLKPQGRFLFNSANRDSLHLRIVRKLGHPEFRSTYEHFREFGYDEMRGILDQIGFDIESSEGIFLHPYLSVPGIDALIQACALDDPEIVEILRELGERAGPKFGFEFLIAARKRL
jgi:2-polyprenyl-3-methyl-5-hydroxy-6-metoxy-1,4-benzoquinol methylase